MPDFTAVGWTLRDIIAKVRLVTTRDVNALTDQQIVNYINRYYQYVMPKELKTFYGYTYYTFFTIAGEDQYTPPDTTYQNYNPQIWIDGFPSDWYLSPDLFYQDYPMQDTQQVVATGDGVNFGFVFTVSNTPILKRSLYVTDGTQILQDDGAGNLTGDGFGFINYASGACSVAFTTQPTNGVNITASCQAYLATRPTAILYYDNKFILRGVPDDVYPVKLQGIKVPTALVNYTDTPYRTDMGPLLAFGACIEIFTDFNQPDQVEQINPQYTRYKDICMQDTHEEYLYQRATPRF